VLERYSFTKAKQETVKSKLDEKVKELTEEYVRVSYAFSFHPIMILKCAYLNT
jgi:hypothetical protein